LFCATLLALLPLAWVSAQATHRTQTAEVPPGSNPCPRAAAGGLIQQPPALFSSHGVLNVRFSCQTATDPYGRTLYCLMTPDGLEEPTLHVSPGDTLNVTLTNNTPASPIEEAYLAPKGGADAMTATSTHIHYHGINTSPT
jgi:FtsP/CotA-like multicopper oxidase with cupredoxin domain